MQTRAGSRISHTYFCEFVEGTVGGAVRDEKSHTLVGNFDSGRAIHVGKTALKQ